jgi:DNA polymerase-3 subunit epsilon
MNDALFSLGTEEETPTEPQKKPIRRDQAELIRAAFSGVGIMDQERRKSIIESCVSREVATLYDLYDTEIRTVVQRIRTVAMPKPATSGSAWDNRDGDTWIDKL